MKNLDVEKINAMRVGGKMLRDMLLELKGMIKPGLDVYQLETRFIEMCNEKQVEPSCKGYKVAGLPPFPTGLCIGINSESVHCYPKRGQLLQTGDIITVDTVIKYNGYHVDSAFTSGVGTISKEDERFIETVKLASANAIKEAIAGNHIGDIGYAMESIMHIAGFDVLYDFVGHGIGEKMHQAPDIPCFGDRGHGQKLVEGMTIAIEALCCQGNGEVEYVKANDWQTRMADGKKFAIFEHTVLVTKDGPEILTK